MTPSQHGLPIHGQQNQLKLGLSGGFGQDLSIQNAPTQLEMVAFLKELVDLRWIGQFTQVLAQGPVLHPCSHEAQDRVCLLDLMHQSSGSHTGNLQAVCLLGLGHVQVHSYMPQWGLWDLQGQPLAGLALAAAVPKWHVYPKPWACIWAKTPSTRCFHH